MGSFGSVLGHWGIGLILGVHWGIENSGDRIIGRLRITKGLDKHIHDNPKAYRGQDPNDEHHTHCPGRLGFGVRV